MLNAYAAYKNIVAPTFISTKISSVISNPVLFHQCDCLFLNPNLFTDIRLRHFYDWFLTFLRVYS